MPTPDRPQEQPVTPTTPEAAKKPNPQEDEARREAARRETEERQRREADSRASENPDGILPSAPSNSPPPPPDKPGDKPKPVEKPGDAKKKDEEEAPSQAHEMMRKIVEFGKKIYEWIVSQGSGALQMTADVLRKLGSDKLASALEWFAGTHKAALNEALNASGIKLKAPTPNPELGEDDPAFKEDVRKLNAGLKLLASRCNNLKYGNDKVVFYNLVMANLGAKTECTVDDLLEASKEGKIPVNPNPTPDKPKDSTTAGGTAPALEALPANTDLRSATPTKITFESKQLGVQLKEEGILVVQDVAASTSKTFKMKRTEVPPDAKPESVTLTVKKALWSGADGIAIDSTIGYDKKDAKDGAVKTTSEYTGEKIKPDDVKKILKEVAQDKPVDAGKFHFEKA